MEPIIQLTIGDETLKFAHVTVQEMMKVKGWTGFATRAAWFEAIEAEDPGALVAAYVIAKKRNNQEVRFSDVDFDLDTLDVKLVDEHGREIEPVFIKNTDGSLKTKNGNPVPALDQHGNAQWIYTDTGEPVPPTVTPLKAIAGT